jgi:hypothetical protein
MPIFGKKTPKRTPLVRVHIIYSITPKGLLRLERESDPPLSLEAVKMLESLKHDDNSRVVYGQENPEPPQVIKELLYHRLVSERKTSSYF